MRYIFRLFRILLAPMVLAILLTASVSATKPQPVPDAPPPPRFPGSIREEQLFPGCLVSPAPPPHGPHHGHTYTCSTSPATCLSPEIKTYRCVHCGHAFQWTGNQLGNHSYSPPQVIPPTAASRGYTLRTCALCGEQECTNITYLEYGDEIRFLIYHEVMPQAYIDNLRGSRSMFVSSENFRSQMELLKQEGCYVMRIEEATDALMGLQPIPARAVCICFDDGYKSNIEYAAPILREYGYPAVIYVTMYALGGDYQPEFDPRGIQKLSLFEYEPYRDLITLGCHTWWHHLDMRSCSLEELQADFEMCRQTYPDYTEYFAYPLGCWTQDIAQLLAQLGFRSAVTTEARPALLGDNLYGIPRYGIYGWYTDQDLYRILNDPGPQHIR